MSTNTLSFSTVSKLTKKLCTLIETSDWKPQIVVGVNRGGSVVGVMLSYYYKVPFQSLGWESLSDKYTPSEFDLDGHDCNLWLPEDAVKGRNILVVFDEILTDTVLKEIMNDWETSVFTEIKWNDNVKFATLSLGTKTDFKIDYVAKKSPSNTYASTYPWENWHESIK